MNDTIYQVTHCHPNRAAECEFTNETAARLWAEAQETASVITWHVEHNLPGLAPALVHRSLGLDVWENGKWRSVNIFGW